VSRDNVDSAPLGLGPRSRSGSRLEKNAIWLRHYANGSLIAFGACVRRVNCRVAPLSTAPILDGRSKKSRRFRTGDCGWQADLTPPGSANQDNRA